jgi:hypothetical protein
VFIRGEICFYAKRGWATSGFAVSELLSKQGLQILFYNIRVFSADDF